MLAIMTPDGRIHGSRRSKSARDAWRFYFVHDRNGFGKVGMAQFLRVDRMIGSRLVKMKEAP